MGAVYEAEQDSPRRKVAFKVIKAGVVSRNLLLRFEIEAQILGKLDHPGIATTYEAGTFGSGWGCWPRLPRRWSGGGKIEAVWGESGQDDGE